jgi:glycosyltransferase involved in cell wall biosynthesis
MKAAIITTYPPRECGIATFTENLIRALPKETDGKGENPSVFVVAMNDKENAYAYPDTVKYTIRESHQKDYLKAADYINYSADICILQHEFGIFGGNSGVYILPLINRLKVPLVVTFHTVLKEPSFSEKAILTEIGKKADRIVVMSKMAVSFLQDIYDIPRRKITVIEHGFPEFDYENHDYYKQKLHLQDKISVMTFGLLSRGKGIETVIRSLPEVVKRFPNLVYLIVGKTHPGVVRVSGEEYRQFLKRLVQKNHLEKHVVFIDSFLQETDLCAYLSAADIYITPYPNEAQITSGTLSYAVGAGTAVVSTPYWHAAELLDKGRGVLFPFNDHEALAQELIQLLENPARMKAIRHRASRYGQKITWPLQGKKYLKVAEQVIKKYRKPQNYTDKVIDPTLLPSLNLTHLRQLTDATGILQHARYNIPDFRHGYCLDDNARALLVANMVYERQKEPDAIQLMSTYLSFINYMKNPDGTFRNFLSFDRQYLDKKGSEDAFGRTIWALGFLLAHAPNDAFFQIAKQLFDASIPHFLHLKSLRGIANTLMGIHDYLNRFPWDEEMVSRMVQMADKLTGAFEKEKDNDWKWFEPILTYDNGLLPAALFCTFEKTEQEKYLKIAEESLHFLEEIIFRGDHIALIGNNGWYKKGEKRAVFDQQPIDAMAMVLMYEKAYLVSENKKDYLHKMFTSFMWFLGENDLHIPLYDYETKGCCDGLQKVGVNRNQGAESMLAYLLSHLTVLEAFEKEKTI